MQYTFDMVDLMESLRLLIKCILLPVLPLCLTAAVKENLVSYTSSKEVVASVTLVDDWDKMQPLARILKEAKIVAIDTEAFRQGAAGER